MIGAAPNPTYQERALSFEDLRGILAHSFPFIMLDKVLDFEPGKRITAIKNVTANEIHFLGHFPSTAIMPGVLIVEALAQTLHVLDTLSRDAEPGRDQPILKYLGSVNITFVKPALPGDQLRLEVDIVKMLKLAVMGKAVARIGSAAIARGELTLISKGDPVA
jgi:3-hydroxyacyl-[acyl-carrier-protein] dehydratase